MLGFKVQESKLRREVLKVASRSQKFVEEKLEKLIEETQINPSKKTEKILLEMDGCLLRTGVKISSEKTGLTKIRVY